MATYSQVCSNVGSFTYGNRFTLYVILTNRDGNPATNQSIVDYNVYFENTSGGGNFTSQTRLYFSINGTVIKDTTSSITGPRNGSVSIASGSITVGHNDDGKKSVSFQALAQSNTFGISGNIQDSFTLTTIPRTSSISCSTANIGSNPTVVITSASSSFRHHVTATLGSETVVVLTDTPGGTYTSWTIPNSFYAQIPNVKSAKATMKCETYSGTVLIGTKSIEFEITTSESACRPTVSATIKDTNKTTKDLTENENKLVKYKSTAQLVITSTTKNSATIKSVTVNGTNVGTSSSITLNYSNVSTASFTIVVTDSRGYTNTSYVVTPSYVDYVPLTVNTNFFRPQPTTGEVQLTYSGKYFDASFGAVANSLSITWQYRVQGASAWTTGGTITPTFNGNTISSKTISLGTIFNYQIAYDFQLIAVDKLTTVTRTAQVSVGMPVFYWGKEFLRVTKKLIVDDEIVKNNGYLPVYRGVTTNFNQALTQGFYSFSGTNIEGSPISTQIYGTLEVIVQKSQTWVASDQTLFIWQIYRDTTGKEYHRFGVNESAMSAWRRIYEETSLNDNPSGTSGTVTLSETSANFTYIEIFYGKSTGTLQSIKVYSPNGKGVTLITGYVDNTTSAQIQVPRLKINGTSITNDVGGIINLGTNAVNLTTGNEVKIYKVVGYR